MWNIIGNRRELVELSQWEISALKKANLIIKLLFLIT